MDFGCGLFIRREASKASKNLTSLFSSLRNPRAKRPFWMISYLEGTRLTAKKLEDAKAFAKKRDLHVLNHLLQPRVKGFTNSVQELHEEVGAIYDITIGYKDGKDLRALPEFSFLVSSYCFGEPRVVQVHQRRIPIDSVTVADEEAFHRFPYNLYHEKHQLLEHRARLGHFPGRHVQRTPISTRYTISSFIVLEGLSIALV
mmetsp:Transcript_16401/g.33416  ORF Transcript_16401/g.33416 Transcript_16401/m.33416 type:complete len:201 (-) Transcript_16401:229-831(-)